MKTIDEHAVNSTAISLISHGEFYKLTDRYRNQLNKRYKRKEYNVTLAIKGLEPIIYKYLKSRDWIKCFDPEEIPAIPNRWHRLAIAQYILEDWENGFRDSER